MKSLYSLTTEMNALIDSETVTDKQLQEVFGNIAEKAQNCAQYNQTLKSQIAVFDDEIKRLETRRAVLKNNLEHFEQYIIENLQRLGVTKLSAGTFQISLVQTQGSLIVDDINAIPPKYITTVQTHTVNKKAIKEEIKQGVKVNGAHIEEGFSLRIK